MPEQPNQSSEPQALLRWHMAVPVTVATAFLQCVGGMFSIYFGNKSSGEVVKRLDDLSHRVEIVSIKQEAIDPHIATFESELRHLNDRVSDIERRLPHG